MAIRKVFKVNLHDNNYVDTINVEFEWNPGFSRVQKEKNINALHKCYHQIFKNDNILEISSKSSNKLGIDLSAFNLTFTTLKKNNTFTVESAFQSSKKFEFGGPYKDLIDKDPRTAKKDIRLKTSGNLISFIFFNQEWPLEPKTLFYDWLYINALYKKEDLSNNILNYDAFTDIEFNHNRSINCQAYSAALFVSLYKRNLLTQAIQSPENFKKVILKQDSKQHINQSSFFEI